LGKMDKAEWRVLVVFILTAAFWIFRVPITNWEWLVAQVPLIGRVDDTIIALSAGLVLFLIPSGTGQALLNWQTAVKLPWQALLLFGGGLSLAAAVSSSGLDQLIGNATQELFSGGAPTWILIIAVTTVVIFLTEFTSNTATAALFMPILLATIAGAEATSGVEIDSMLVLIPAGLAASCAFMLPVATPPNIIVFGSGHVSIRQMVRTGFLLNLVAILLIPLLTYFIGQWVMQPAA
jgi:sodium-dependent dicarboxylate transporter 2/3/5